MPYETVWVDPETFLVYKDVEIFHTYPDNEKSEGTRDFWFTQDCLGDEGRDFDIRDLYGSAELDPGLPIRSVSDPSFRIMSEKQREELHHKWRDWYLKGFDEARREILKRAIDEGKLKPLAD
jgi:hypothetical protein